MGTLAKAKFEKDMQARSEEVKVGTGRWNFIGRNVAVSMVDSCQALQEAKNAIAAKMGGGWPCMEKMDLTCIRHKSISHVQGGHVGWKVCPASNLLGFLG